MLVEKEQVSPYSPFLYQHLPRLLHFVGLLLTVWAERGALFIFLLALFYTLCCLSSSRSLPTLHHLSWKDAFGVEKVRQEACGILGFRRQTGRVGVHF